MSTMSTSTLDTGFPTNPPHRVDSTSNLSMASTSTNAALSGFQSLDLNMSKEESSNSNRFGFPPPPHRVDSTSNLSMASTGTNAALSGFESLNLKVEENQPNTGVTTDRSTQQREPPDGLNMNGHSLASSDSSGNMNNLQSQLPLGASADSLNRPQDLNTGSFINGQQTEGSSNDSKSNIPPGEGNELPLGASSSNLSSLQGEPSNSNTPQSDLDVIYRQFPLHCLNDSHKTMASRARVVREWSSKGGVLLMGYEMYRLLCSRRVAPSRSRKSKKSGEPLIIDIDEEERNKDFLTGS